MRNFITTSAATQQGEEDHPLIRAAYAVGVGLLMVGTVLPHSERWTMFGIGLIVVSYRY